MALVTKVYKEHFPALRFIGTRYTNDDRGPDGGFDKQWGKWGDTFAKMKKIVSTKPFDDTPIGLMMLCESKPAFSYWIGLFYPARTVVPDGFDHYDLPESDIGVGWVCGKEESGEIWGSSPHEAVCGKLLEDGICKLRNDMAGEGSDTICFFERYNSPRSTEKDVNGNITLDYGNYII